jgi:serine/threonine-protein kinase
MTTCPADGTALVEESETADGEALPPGTVVGEYRIERLLGHGGMGEVYGAHHPVIGKRVAIKVMNRACSVNPANVERFVQEAKAVNAIGHSNIVDIFSFGRTSDGRCYFVMEWLQGESLRTTLGNGPVELRRTYEILDEVLRALEAAHAAGIVHRDLKPDNIFLVKSRDDHDRVKLLDFGIAKLAVDRTGARTSITQTGMVVGTPTHMSPEQASGGSVGPATDIYALGVVAFELATGKLPFTAESSVQLMAKHLDEPPPMPRSIRPIGLPFERLILDMLSKRPTDRPSATDVRKRLVSLREAPSDGAPSAADQQQTLPGARAVAAKVRAGTEPTEALPASASLIPVIVSAPSIPALTPAPSASSGHGTSVSVSRMKWPVIGAIAALIVGAVIVFATAGDDSPTTPPQATTPVTAPAPAPQPVPSVPEAEPSAAAPASVAAPEPTAAEPTGRRPENVKPTSGRKPPARRPTPAAQPAPPPVTAQPTPPAAPAPVPQPPAAKPRSDHDVDAVHDPFSDVGAKK